jgi:hypothetical protein
MASPHQPDYSQNIIAIQAEPGKEVPVAAGPEVIRPIWQEEKMVVPWQYSIPRPSEDMQGLAARPRSKWRIVLLIILILTSIAVAAVVGGVCRREDYFEK